MTFEIVEKTESNGFKNLQLFDGDQYVYIRASVDIDDQVFIDSCNEQKAFDEELEKERQKEQAEIEANINV